MVTQSVWRGMSGGKAWKPSQLSPVQWQCPESGSQMAYMVRARVRTTGTGSVLQGRERKATPTEAGGDRTVRCVLMNEQGFLNFRSKDDTQCFYFVLIFFFYWYDWCFHSYYGKAVLVCSEGWMTTVEFLDLELLVKGFTFQNQHATVDNLMRTIK